MLYLFLSIGEEVMVTVQDILDINNQLKAWREERHLTEQGQRDGLVDNILEEIQEFKDAKDDSERIDALCDMYIFYNNCWDLDTPHAALLANKANYYIHHKAKYLFPNRMFIKSCKGDVVTHCGYLLAEMFRLGYHPLMCLDETIKEISSRVGSWNEEKKKFIKDVSASAMAKWYKADYNLCRFEGSPGGEAIRKEWLQNIEQSCNDALLAPDILTISSTIESLQNNN